MRLPIGYHHGQRLGRLLVTATRQPDGAPILDGCTSGDDRDNRYGSVAVRFPGTHAALVVGWRGWLRGYRPRRLRNWVRWNLRGRPHSVGYSMTPSEHDGRG